MIPVQQTKRGRPHPPPEERGDCFDACLASILEVPIEAVHVPHDEDWWEHAQAVVERHGYRLLYVATSEGPTGPPKASAVGEWIGPAYWLAGIPSTTLGAYENGRPVGHMVVMRGAELVHDPTLGEARPLGPLPDDVPVLDAFVLFEPEPRSKRADGKAGPRFDRFTVGELQALTLAFAEARAYDESPPRPWDHPVWGGVAAEASAALDRAAADEGWDERICSPASGDER
jgi:hypothetical protein